MKYTICTLPMLEFQPLSLVPKDNFEYQRLMYIAAGIIYIIVTSYLLYKPSI